MGGLKVRIDKSGVVLVKSIKLLTYLFIAFLLFSDCGSNSDKKNSNTSLFPNFGLKSGDVIDIEILFPNTGISGYKKTITIDTGTSIELSVTAYDINGGIHPDITIGWSSTDVGIVTAGSSGMITGLSEGSAIITAKLIMTDGTVLSDNIIVVVLPSPEKGREWATSKISLPQPIWDHASAIWDKYIYVSGGNSSCNGGAQDCGFTDKVYYATLNTDGALGSFRTTTSLPLTLRGHAMLAYNNYMYLIGGIVQPYFGSAPYPDPNNFQTVLNEKVYYAHINPDGSLSDWIDTTFPLPPVVEIPADKAGLFALSATVHNGYIYVTGGWNVEQKKNVNTVLVSPINEADGSIGPWIHNFTSDLPYDVSKHTSAAVTVNGENYLYVIGGNSGAIGGTRTFHREIYYTKIAPDGIPDKWTLASNVLPVQLIDHATAVIDNRYLVVLGGRNGDDSMPYEINPYVYYYFINDNGDLSPVKVMPPMPALLFHLAAVADKTTGNIYVTGGADGDTEKPEHRTDGIYYLFKTNP